MQFHFWMMYMRNLKRFETVVFALCVLVSAMNAQQDTVFLSVDQLFERGEQYSTQIKASKLRELMAEEREKDAKLAMSPDLNINLGAAYIGQPVVFQQGLANPTYPETPDWSQSYSVELRQPLYASGRIKTGIRMSEIESRIAAFETADDLASLKLVLLQHYLDLFRLYKQEDVMDSEIKRSERRLQDIRRLKEEGLITNNDVLRSELQLTDDRLSMMEVRNQIRIVSMQLAVLLELDENSVLQPDTLFLEQNIPALAEYDSYVEEAYEANPSMQILYGQSELAREQLNDTKTNYRPSIYFVASDNLARPIARTLDDLYNNSWSIGLEVSIPLSPLYKDRHKQIAAEYNLKVAAENEENGRRQMRVRMREADLHHEEALERVKSMELSQKQAWENYRIMENCYLNQVAILTDLLDAQSLYINTELQLITARTQVVYTYYEMEKERGKL